MVTVSEGFLLPWRQGEKIRMVDCKATQTWRATEVGD